MTPRCAHVSTEVASPSEVERALEAASKRVAAIGGRLTRPRRRVLELLLAGPEPTKAYDLVARFFPDARVAKPATIYRALQFLEASGLILRLSTTKSYVARDPEQPGSPSVVLLCDCCGACRQVPLTDMDDLTSVAAATGYSIDRVTVQAQGLCSRCRPTPA